MRSNCLLALILSSLVSAAWATALTYKFAPNENYCFHAYVDDKGAKVAFYFAVSISSVTLRVGKRY